MIRIRKAIRLEVVLVGEYQDGMLIKGSGDGVYLIENGMKRLIISQEVFDQIGFHWDAVQKVEDTLLLGMKEGPIIQSSQLGENFCKVPLPKEYDRSALDWARRTFIDHRALKEFYTEIYPFEKKFRGEPKGLEKPNRVEFIGDTDFITKSPAAYVAVMPGGRVCSTYNVVTPDNRLVWDVSIEYNKFYQEHSLFQYTKMPQATFLQESAAVLTHCASNYYFHWMFDVLPRLHLLRQSGINVEKYIMNKIGEARFKHQTLSILGIDQSQIIETHFDFHLTAKRLIVPSLPGGSNYPKWATEFLRKEFMQDRKIGPKNGYERIYINRSQASYRKVLNEQQVIDFLANYGFKSITLENMALDDQIRLFSSAKVIVSPHGGGLTNLVFCSPNTKVIEFFSPIYVNPLYWVISTHIPLDYYYFVGERKNTPIQDNINGLRDDDILVNLSALEKILKMADVNQAKKG